MGGAHMKTSEGRNKWGHNKLLTKFTNWVGMLPWQDGTATSYTTKLWDPVPQLACFLKRVTWIPKTSRATNKVALAEVKEPTAEGTLSRCLLH